MGFIKKLFDRFRTIVVVDESVIVPKTQMKRIVIIGDGFCGKTSLIRRYLHEHFISDTYSPTLFDVQTKYIDDNVRPITLVINDTAGQRDFDALRPSLYFHGDVIVVCFSVDDPNSLANIRDRWQEEICKFCEDVPIILVGTKSDLAKNENSSECDNLKCETCRLVSRFGRTMATLIGAVKYMECSALMDKGVTDIFEEALSLALARDVKFRRKSSFFRRGSLLPLSLK